MNNTFSLLFHLRRPKSYTKGPQPIYLRITVNGKRAEMSTQRECEPTKWNGASGRAIGTKEEAKQLNSYLDTLVSKLYQHQKDLIHDGEIPTAEVLKNKLTGHAGKARMIVAIFENHNNNIEALIDKEYSPGTLIRYKTSLQHTIDFMQWKYNVSDMDIQAVNHQFITDYDFYLRSVKNCNNNTAVKYIKNFKKIIRICIANGWLNKDPFVNFKAKVREVDRVFLTDTELEVISAKEFQVERVAQVRDIFLFSCYTGLAYIDVKTLTKNNMVIGIDGKYWINTFRTKTDTPSNIPLLPQALAIIEKYKTHPQVVNQAVLLPVSSNQKMNAYLKEIADLCGITKELTFHTARHTFATTVTLSNGIPIESVSKMLGHKNLRTTQHYAKILDKKVSTDMEILFRKFESKGDNKITVNQSE